MDLGQQGRDLAQQVAQRPVLRIRAAALLCCTVLLWQQVRRRRGIERPPRGPPRPRRRPPGRCAASVDLRRPAAAVVRTYDANVMRHAVPLGSFVPCCLVALQAHLTDAGEVKSHEKPQASVAPQGGPCRRAGCRPCSA